jgi:pimeloyl-ACP methyl ester carboxylesterase
MSDQVMRRIAVDAAAIEYSDCGAGEALRLIHAGVFGAWFAPLQELSAPGFRTIRMLRAGYTDGPTPDRHLTIVDHTRHAGLLLDTLGIGHADVLAHSSGCLIALQLTVDRPALVDSLIPSEPSIGGGLTPASFGTIGETVIGPAVSAAMAGDIPMAFDTFMRGVCAEDYQAAIIGEHRAGRARRSILLRRRDAGSRRMDVQHHRGSADHHAGARRARRGQARQRCTTSPFSSSTWPARRHAHHPRWRPPAAPASVPPNTHASPPTSLGAAPQPTQLRIGQRHNAAPEPCSRRRKSAPPGCPTRATRPRADVAPRSASSSPTTTPRAPCRKGSALTPPVQRRGPTTGPAPCRVTSWRRWWAGRWGNGPFFASRGCVAHTPQVADGH